MTHSHLIIPRLYVGDCISAQDLSELKENKISHIVSLGGFDYNHAGIIYKNIHIEDLPKEMIIQHFNDTFDFIEEARSIGTGVLIHCQAGISRSATVAAAYMMRKGNIGYEQALTMIKIRRTMVAPNEGFLAQLELYESLNYEVDPKHAAYRQFMLANMDEYNIYNEMENYTLAADPEYTPPSAPSQLPFVSLRCKKCRRTLVHAEHVIEHKPGKGQQSFSYFKRTSELNVTDVAAQPSTEASVSSTQVNKALNPLLAALATSNQSCSSYFIEPMEWMGRLQDSGEILGRIDCPKCCSKLGAYNWSGEQCSCGRWITPSFMLHRKQVDEIRNTSNFNIRKS
ncbi:protein-tyrosine phosphatase-like protein [Halteromyces radiatus]|uniref:protein-tyrosine phosphatase-like protein n=1 Tax=Halteromyces radiatus TaxID=101107 RepID=UPI002220286E|nr:protein-tyrosine phosphatase-like protein [Halteromyces radiatus]KAI8093231.1 protein-tyrosine phosphatase-like protein [Halteromyces radiatus]